MIKVLEERHDPPKPPFVREYIYRCSHCGSVIGFDENDIEMDCIDSQGNIDEWVNCPVCKHCIELFWMDKWYHRKGLYKLFHRIKENKEE